jgi:hypothetical protein
MAESQLAGIFSKVQNQGKLIDIYASPSQSLRLILLTVTGFLGLAGGGLAWGINLSDQMTRYGPAILQKILFPPIAAVFGWLILFTLIGVALLRRPKQAGGLYEHGIALSRSNEFIPIRWEGIYSVAADIRKDVFLGIPLSIKPSYTIRTWDNRMFTLSSNIQRLPELAEKIEDAITPILLEKVDQALSERHLVPFGTLQIHQDGLILNQQRINWGEISAYQVNNGFLEMTIADEGQKKARKIPIASLQNLQILLILFSRFISNPS